MHRNKDKRKRSDSETDDDDDDQSPNNESYNGDRSPNNADGSPRKLSRNANGSPRKLSQNDPEFRGEASGIFGAVGSPPSRTTSMSSSPASMLQVFTSSPASIQPVFAPTPAPMQPVFASSPASMTPVLAAPAPARSMRLTEGEPYATFDDSQYGEEEHSQPISAELRSELSSDSSEDDGLPDIADIFSDELTDRDGTPITETVSSAIGHLTALATKVAGFSRMITQRISDIGDNIIAATKLRRKQRAAADAVNRIKIANEKLAAMNDKSKEITTIGVLRMIELETLIENIMDDAIPESIRDVPALLVMPILEIVCHFEEYFDWKTEVSQITVDRAYSEFRNKQRIRDMVLRLYGENITLNQVIDELFLLYNRNFNTLANISNRSLSVDGRLRVVKSIHTEAPKTKIATIPSENPFRKAKALPVLSAVNYSSVWDEHAMPQANVDAEMATIRIPVPATQDNTPAAVARPFGYNDRHMDIAADIGLARFDAPLTRARQGDDIGSQDTVDIGSQDSITSELPDAAEYEFEEGAYEYPQERFEFLAGQRKYIGAVVSENVERRLAEYAARREHRNRPTQKIAKIAEIATQRMTVADNLMTVIQETQQEFVNGIFSDLSPAEKQQSWERQIHRVFIQWYKESEGLEAQRVALDRPAAKAAPSSSLFGNFLGKGGKKSHKHRKNHKKHTRKNNKRSTRKNKKNHKKRAGHTKKH